MEQFKQVTLMCLCNAAQAMYSDLSLSDAERELIDCVIAFAEDKLEEAGDTCH